MPPARQLVEVFVVRKKFWFYTDEYDAPVGSDAIQTFRDRHKAEEYRQEQERLTRRGEDGGRLYNPFLMNSNDLSDQSSHDEDEFAELAESLGFEPPERAIDWCAWWEENHEDFTPEQREAIWALFDRIELYEVVA